MLSAAADRRDGRLAVGGVLAAVALAGLAMAVPWVADWNVHVNSFPPLHAEWDPRVGAGTAAAVVIAVLGVVYGAGVAQRLGWRALLAASYVASVLWMTSLATVDGWDGIGVILGTQYEYLQTARSVTDFSATLHEYVSRIPLHSVDNWPVHIAGHPPGALAFFVVLVALGLGSGLAAGWVVLLLAATTPVAVLVTVRRLGAEQHARSAAPFLVLGPAAVWMAVSADALFGAVAAWGLCCLAVAATSSGGRAVAWSVAAGLLLGYCVMLSYGLPLLGVAAVAVLVVARSWRPLPWAALSAIAVVVAFAVAGFAWWEAYPVLHDRYWDGVASRRPLGYWLWGNLAALVLSAGPVLGAAVALWGDRARRLRSLEPATRVIALLTGAAVVMVLAADLSGMSKAEVERIWLPFVPWLLLGTALLPGKWARPLLAVQVIAALLIQHLLSTGW